MKKILLATALSAAISTSVQADTLLGLYVGGQIWATEASGTFGDSGNNQADFNLDDQEQGSFYVAFEHPLPLIPNIKVARTSLDTDGITTLSSSIDFRGETYDSTSEVATKFDLTYTDYTLYYEIFDNDLVSIDFGITGRDFDTDITLSQEGKSSGTLSASGIVPMLYAYTNIGLPFTGFNVFGEGNFLSIGDHTLYDFQVGVSYELIDNLAVDVDLTLGYRAVQLEIDDLDNLHSNLDFKGVFAGAIVHF
ncbi:TIGR04219 family outer membrane beta-barrel protein [Pseudocolwellia sp. HL-MZ19]|uniref:TIGR04219 family outer membrane beta-barrel protein n=1 Tax=unclassified Pseudocolwellia TaxID=2848178 RepID=UPI003CED9316